MSNFHTTIRYHHTCEMSRCMEKVIETEAKRQREREREKKKLKEKERYTL